MLFHFCFQGELLHFYAAFTFLCSLDFPEKNESPLTITASGPFVLSKGMRKGNYEITTFYHLLNPLILKNTSYFTTHYCVFYCTQDCVQVVYVHNLKNGKNKRMRILFVYFTVL